MPSCIHLFAGMDSDGDGWPNGFELGDPCGIWQRHNHNGPPAWHNDISHPGNCSSTPCEHSLNYTEYCGRCICDDDKVQHQIKKLYEKRWQFIAKLPEDARKSIQAELAKQPVRDPDPKPCGWHPGPPAPGHHHDDPNSEDEGKSKDGRSLRHGSLR